MTELKLNTDQNVNEHASLSDLVAMRDGERVATAAHVERCEFCQARLEEVYSNAKSLQDTLLFEAELPVPAAVWSNLEQHLRDTTVADDHTPPDIATVQHNPTIGSYAHAKPSFWSSVNTAIYSLTAAVVFTGLVSLYTFQGQQDSRIETRALQASIQSLMDSSRGLENVLENVVAQNSTLTLSDQSAAERLQWRLMLVDQKIHESESSGDVSYEQIKALWASRIDALTELNQLYYTNQVAVNDGEF